MELNFINLNKEYSVNKNSKIKNDLPAVILAAGQGKRLLPLTNELPKPLLEINNRKILEYIISNLAFSGIRHFIIITGYKAEKIENWIKNEFCSKLFKYCEEKFNNFSDSIAFSFIRQQNINGTGGAALLAEKHIIENGYNYFLLTYGDILVHNSVYSRLIKEFYSVPADLYLVGNYLPFEKISKGAAIYYKDNWVVDIIEKPPINAPKTDLNNAGIYIFNKDIFIHLKNTSLSIRQEIEITATIKTLINQYKKIRVVKMKKNEFWCDIGTIETYNKLKSDNSLIKRYFDL